MKPLASECHLTRAREFKRFGSEKAGPASSLSIEHVTKNEKKGKNENARF